jgi:hypothetical protein
MPCPRVPHQQFPAVDLMVARPSRPREDHFIDPGRWKDWLVPRSPEAGILGGPPWLLETEFPQSLDLGCGPKALQAMAPRDPSTCPDPTISAPRNNGGRRQVGTGNPISSIPNPSAATGSNLDFLLAHFWSRARVPPSSPPYHRIRLLVEWESCRRSSVLCSSGGFSSAYHGRWWRRSFRPGQGEPKPLGGSRAWSACLAKGGCSSDLLQQHQGLRLAAV